MKLPLWWRLICNPSRWLICNHRGIWNFPEMTDLSSPTRVITNNPDTVLTPWNMDGSLKEGAVDEVHESANTGWNQKGLNWLTHDISKQLAFSGSSMFQWFDRSKNSSDSVIGNTSNQTFQRFQFANAFRLCGSNDPQHSRMRWTLRSANTLRSLQTLRRSRA